MLNIFSFRYVTDLSFMVVITLISRSFAYLVVYFTLRSIFCFGKYLKTRALCHCYPPPQQADRHQPSQNPILSQKSSPISKF